MGAFKKTGGFGGHDNRGGDDRPRFANKGFGGKSFGNKSFGGGHTRQDGGREDRGPVQLYAATCAECGKQCEVPFRPNGQKPVFCKECFGSKRGAPVGEFRGPAPERTFPKRDFASTSAPTHAHTPNRDQALPYTPKATADPRIDELKRQVDIVTKKLDSLTDLVRSLASNTAPAAKVVAPTASVTPAAKSAPAKVVAKVAPKAVKKVAKKAAKAKK